MRKCGACTWVRISIWSLRPDGGRFRRKAEENRFWFLVPGSWLLVAARDGEGAGEDQSPAPGRPDRASSTWFGERSLDFRREGRGGLAPSRTSFLLHRGR